MTDKHVNLTVKRLYTEFLKSKSGEATPEFYEKRKQLCIAFKKIHNVVGSYQAMSPKNVLKMVSACSCLRFAEPFRVMLKVSNIKELN